VIAPRSRGRWRGSVCCCRIEGAYDCIKAFFETDLTEDLKRIDVPILILHGDADQIVPIAASAMMSSKLMKKSTLKIYPGAPQRLWTTLAGQASRPARVS
jgi:non-heme chloroperoxidase